MIQPTALADSIPRRPFMLGLALLSTAPSAGASEPPDYPAPTPDVPSEAVGLFSETFYLTMGFSFMVGLAMGFALKVAFKIALALIGLILLALFGLQYADLIQINWAGLEGHYNGWVDWLSAHAGAFFGFVGDNLPGVASFLAGLALGLKL